MIASAKGKARIRAETSENGRLVMKSRGMGNPGVNEQRCKLRQETIA
jgi:hypothetical protein